MEQSKFYQIKNIIEQEYTLVDCDGSVITRPIRDIDKSASAFTIQDAKDGDVLAYVTDKEDLWIMIYWSLYEPYEGHVHYHALLVNDNFSDKGTCCICIDNLKPATKEQRDTLFAKIKETGYEWDAKNKQLKKIEPKEEPTEFECGYKKAIEDSWGYFSKGLPSECRDVVKPYFDKAMNEKLKELSQG